MASKYFEIVEENILKVKKNKPSDWKGLTENSAQRMKNSSIPGFSIAKFQNDKEKEMTVKVSRKKKI